MNFCEGAFCLFCHLDNNDLCSYPYGGFYCDCGYVFGCCFELGCGYHFDLDRAANDDASSFFNVFCCDGDVIDILGRSAEQDRERIKEQLLIVHLLVKELIFLFVER